MKRRDFMFGAAAALAGGCTSAAGRKDVAMQRRMPARLPVSTSKQFVRSVVVLQR